MWVLVDAFDIPRGMRKYEMVGVFESRAKAEMWTDGKRLTEHMAPERVSSIGVECKRAVASKPVGKNFRQYIAMEY